MSRPIKKAITLTQDELLAGVYQPFYPIELSNVLWIVVYSVSALWLLVEIAFIANQKRRKEFWDKRQREREYQSSTFDED